MTIKYEGAKSVNEQDCRAVENMALTGMGLEGAICVFSKVSAG